MGSMTMDIQTMSLLALVDTGEIDNAYQFNTCIHRSVVDDIALQGLCAPTADYDDCDITGDDRGGLLSSAIVPSAETEAIVPLSNHLDVGLDRAATVVGDVLSAKDSGWTLAELHNRLMSFVLLELESCGG